MIAVNSEACVFTCVYLSLYACTYLRICTSVCLLLPACTYLRVRTSVCIHLPVCRLEKELSEQQRYTGNIENDLEHTVADLRREQENSKRYVKELSDQARRQLCNLCIVNSYVDVDYVT